MPSIKQFLTGALLGMVVFFISSLIPTVGYLALPHSDPLMYWIILSGTSIGAGSDSGGLVTLGGKLIVNYIKARMTANQEKIITITFATAREIEIVAGLLLIVAGICLFILSYISVVILFVL